MARVARGVHPPLLGSTAVLVATFDRNFFVVGVHDNKCIWNSIQLGIGCVARHLLAIATKSAL